MRYEYCVLDWNPNKKEIEYYNIFNSITFYDLTMKLCKKYKKEKMTFDEFVEEFRRNVQYVMWGRYEYEISVGAPFETDCEKLEKIDAYYQVLPNVRVVAKYVLEKYYPRLKIKEEKYEQD